MVLLYIFACWNNTSKLMKETNGAVTISEKVSICWFTRS